MGSMNSAFLLGRFSFRIEPRSRIITVEHTEFQYSGRIEPGGLIDRELSPQLFFLSQAAWLVVRDFPICYTESVAR
jgi:hypothetical protein